MSKKVKVYNDTMKAHKFTNFNGVVTMDDTRWFQQGVIGTEHGFVSTYRQSAPHAHGNADFIYRGNWYRRQWNRPITERGLTILAHRFVRDVVEGRFRKS